MAEATHAGDSRRVLDPMDRTAEVLFGLIMALSFTGTIEVATTGRDDVKAVLYAALGCNIAWGLVGHLIGRHAGIRPLVMGMAMVVIGVVLVGTTIALGG